MIRIIEAPSPADVGPTVDAFLEWMGEPSWLHIPGQDRSRCRAFVTLLHGNEPSGIRALHQLIYSGLCPAVDLVCFIGVVQTALGPPLFSRRNQERFRDMNRCFRAPFQGEEGEIARQLLRELRTARPEALVDMHNTSCPSPPYGVSTRLDAAREGLISLFASILIHTDQRLGALIEATEDDFPTVVIEAGGSADAEADLLALRGLEQYFTAESLPKSPPVPVTVLSHPIRVELREGARLAFDTGPVPGADLTLRADFDRRNFSVVEPGEVLGWLGPAGLNVLGARDGSGRERARELFAVRDGCLHAARPLQPLMVTTDPMIARSDCLFYVVETEDA